MTQFPVEPSPGGVLWTVQFSDTDQRQLTTAEVIRAFENRQLSAYSMVCKEGLAWTQIGNVPHLVHAISTVVKRRNTTPPPPVAAPPVAAPPVAAPPVAEQARRAAEAPLSTPLKMSFPQPPLDSQVAVPLVIRNSPGTQLVDASDRDIQTTPGVNRGTSTVTPFTVVSPPEDGPPDTGSRWSTARLTLLGAVAAVLLFGGAMSLGVFKTESRAVPAAVQPAAVQPAAVQPAAVQPAAVQPSTPGSAELATGTTSATGSGVSSAAAAPGATAPVILDFDSLPVDGSNASTRTQSPGATPSITLEDARRAMLEPSVATEPASKDDTGSEPSSASTKSPSPAGAGGDPATPPGTFDNAAARAALASASQRAQGCLGMGLVRSSGKVVVVFNPSGSVDAVNILSPDFAKPPLGPCLVTAFKQASVPPFIGSPTAVSKTFTQ